jgi:hypothetical protein
MVISTSPLLENGNFGGYLFSKKTPLYMSKLVTFFWSPSGKILPQKNNAHYIIQKFYVYGWG